MNKRPLPPSARPSGSRALLLAALSLAFSTAALADDGTAAFSQRLVFSGNGGTPSCTQGDSVSSEDFVCHPAEIPPSAAQRTLVVTASGHAIGSVVVTDDGFGSGKPGIGVKNGTCPADKQVDGSQQQIGVRAEFVVTPAHGAQPRTIPVVLMQPQPGEFLRNGRGRQVFALPQLEQPLASEKPVDLGMVNPGDHIKLRLLAFGTMTSCENGAFKQQPVQAGLWGPSSTQASGYLTSPATTSTWNDTKVPPFKAVATISY